MSYTSEEIDPIVEEEEIKGVVWILSIIFPDNGCFIVSTAHFSRRRFARSAKYKFEFIVTSDKAAELYVRSMHTDDLSIEFDVNAQNVLKVDSLQLSYIEISECPQVPGHNFVCLEFRQFFPT